MDAREEFCGIGGDCIVFEAFAVKKLVLTPRGEKTVPALRIRVKGEEYYTMPELVVRSLLDPWPEAAFSRWIGGMLAYIQCSGPDDDAICSLYTEKHHVIFHRRQLPELRKKLLALAGWLD